MRLENLYPFTEWQVLWLVSFPGLPHLQFLITFSMQEKVGEGPSHGKNNPGLLPPLLYIVSDQKLEALGAKLLEVVLEENAVVLLLRNNVSTCIAKVAHFMIHSRSQFVP